MKLNPAHTRKGIAMMLVLFALVLATVLGLSFLAAQNTTIGISQNIRQHAKARYIAETALAATLKEIQNNANWASTYPIGVWVANQAWAGGTYTISAEDGADFNGSGAVGGTGSFTSTPPGPVTIVALGNYAGVTHTVRAIVTRAAATQNPNGLAVSDYLNMWNNSTVDAFNSAAGKYGGSNILLNKAVVSTNAVYWWAVLMASQARINGNLQIGPLGVPGDVVVLWNQAQVTGAITAMTSVVAIPSVASPTGMPASSGGFSVSGSSTTTINSNRHYSSFSAWNNAVVNVSGKVTILCDGVFQMSNNTTLNIPVGSSLTLYTGGGAYFYNNAQANSTTGLPADFQINVLGNWNLVQLDNNAQVCAQVVNPGGRMEIWNNGQFFGTNYGRQFVMGDNGQFHMDIAASGSVSSGSGGSGSSQAPMAWYWSEQP